MIRKLDQATGKFGPRRAPFQRQGEQRAGPAVKMIEISLSKKRLAKPFLVPALDDPLPREAIKGVANRCRARSERFCELRRIEAGARGVSARVAPTEQGLGIGPGQNGSSCWSTNAP